ncbi:MAG: hypothetical protein RJA47_93, partial [Actinomycetota bacterium]
MKRFLAIVLVVVSAGSVGAHGANADAEEPVVTGTSALQAKHNPAITKGWGVTWELGSPMYNSYMYTDTGGASSSTQTALSLCSSTNDAACAPSSNTRLSADSILGPCQSDTEIGCLVSVSAQLPGGVMTALNQLGTSATYFPEDSRIGLARGSEGSFWRASDGSTYFVAPKLTQSMTFDAGQWKKPTSVPFLMEIRRVPSSYTRSPRSVALSDSVLKPGSKVVGQSGGGIMESFVKFRAGTRFRVSVRVPSAVVGWFQGRLKDAVVGARGLTNGSVEYTIEADPATVYVAGAEASSEDPASPVYGESLTSQIWGMRSPNSLNDYTKWKPYLGDRAILSVGQWIVSSFGGVNPTCFDAANGSAGIVSTNSAFYSPTAPMYNSATGAVDYKVASPHFDENGAVAVGSYSLSIATAAVQCMYKTAVVPDAAELSTVYDDGSESYTVTQSLTTKDGWLNVSVAGLHFSSPTISAKFGTISSNSNGTTKGNFAALMAGAQLTNSTSGTKQTTSAAGPGNHVKTVVSGAKATVTVTLAAKGTFSVYRKVGKKLTLVKKVSGKKGVNKVTTSYLKGYSF